MLIANKHHCRYSEKIYKGTTYFPLQFGLLQQKLWLLHATFSLNTKINPRNNRHSHVKKFAITRSILNLLVFKKIADQ